MGHPPAPTGADHTIGAIAGAIKGHSASEFRRQFAGQPLAQGFVIGEHDREARAAKDQSPTLIEEMAGVDLRVGQGLASWCIDRNRFTSWWFAQIDANDGIIAVECCLIGGPSAPPVPIDQCPGLGLEKVLDFLKGLQWLQRPSLLKMFMVELGPARPAIHSH